MYELAPLFRLRWRGLQESLIYWVRTGLEYDPSRRTTSERLYGLYLLVVISLLVLLPGWADALAIAYQAGHVLTPHLRAALLAALPALIVLGQVALAMAALRSSPFKLSGPDSAYIAASPVPRGAPVLTGFLFHIAVRLPVWALLAAFVAVALAQPDKLDTATLACLAVGVTTAPLVALSWGLAWSIGLLRMSSPAARNRRFVWLAPLAALVPASLLPAIARWPGGVLTASMRHAGIPGQTWWLAGLAMVAVATVTWVGNRANMTLVAAESAMYARLRELGFMARVFDPALAGQIRRQEKLRAKRFRLRLPRGAWATGLWAAAARAAVGRLHHPLTLLRPLLWGAALSRLGGTLVLGHADLRAWIYWLIGAVVTAPRSLVVAFQEDVDEPFLRQFLPANTLLLLPTDAAVPFGLLCIGILLAWVGQPAAPSVALGGSALSLVMGLIVLLSQGAGLVPLGPGRGRISPAASIAAGFAAIVVTGLATRTAVAALLVAVACALALGRLIAASGQ